VRTISFTKFEETADDVPW